MAESPVKKEGGIGIGAPFLTMPGEAAQVFSPGRKTGFPVWWMNLQAQLMRK
jgi:hypothetical protein